MGAYQAEIASFVNAIVTGSEPEAGLIDGLMSIRIALACKRSLAEHRPVRLDEIR